MMGTLLSSQETTTEQDSSSSSSASSGNGNPIHHSGHSSIIGSLMKLMIVVQRFQSLALVTFLQFYFLKLFIVSVIVNEKKEYSPEERRSLINDMKLFSEEYQLEVLRDFFENRDKFVRKYLS
jgi:predicted lipid-binding transport protein (Tim44 family)